MAVTSIANKLKSGSLLVGNAYYVPPSFESIATLTGNGSSTSLTFTSIPSTFTHLQIRAFGRNSSGYIRFNSDTGSNYARHRVRGDGSNVTVAASVSQPELFGFELPNSGDPASIYGVGVLDIHDYASTTKYKTIRSLTGVDFNGSGNVYLFSGLWMNTAAISSITIYSPAAAPTTDTTFALYGIKG